jgi:Tol biopolymer transport system component
MNMPRSLSIRVLAAPALVAVLAPTGVAQTTTRVSVSSNGVEANFDCNDPVISADGRFVAFDTRASNLVPGDTNGTWDVFIHDNLSGTTTFASADSAGVQGNSWSGFPSISATGRYVVFWSSATNLVSGAIPPQVYLHDCLNGTNEIVSVSTTGIQQSVPGTSTGSAVSPDGRFVVFESDASNLVQGDTNGQEDIFIRDRQAGTTERVSVASSGKQANLYSAYPSVSDDGRFIAFESAASNLVPGDTNGVSDVFVRDRLTGITERVSVGPGGVQADLTSRRPSMSADGRFVAFYSLASNLIAGNASTYVHVDVFVHDRQTGTNELISVDSSGVQGNDWSYDPSISADGRYVAFWSMATNLVPGDTNGNRDVFLHDRQTGSTIRASVSTAGTQGNGDSYTGYSSVSLGGHVTFWSPATNLVAGDTNGLADIFIRDPACTGLIADYCTAKTNSLGCLPSIGSVGIPSQSGPDNFFVTASNVRNKKLGMMIWSLTQDNQPFFGGTLCVHSPIKRTPGQNSGGSSAGDDCTGTYSFHFSQAYMAQQLLPADTTVFAQFWSRDPGFAPPNNVGLTNGLQFTICP